MLEFKLDTEHPTSIPCDRTNLDGLLHIPKDARGIVLFAHGSGSSRFDIGFLAERLIAATHWVMRNPVLKELPMGYFGASTGAGAALVAAARMAAYIKAVVSRGGRPDMATDSLAYVEAPTLLIVGAYFLFHMLTKGLSSPRCSQLSLENVCLPDMTCS